MICQSHLFCRYVVARPTDFDASRDQNSLVLLRRGLFVESTIVDHTPKVYYCHLSKKNTAINSATRVNSNPD